jgi:hypothetical protein
MHKELNRYAQRQVANACTASTVILHRLPASARMTARACAHASEQRQIANSRNASTRNLFSSTICLRVHARRHAHAGSLAYTQAADMRTPTIRHARGQTCIHHVSRLCPTHPPTHSHCLPDTRPHTHGSEAGGAQRPDARRHRAAGAQAVLPPGPGGAPVLMPRDCNYIP